MRWTGSGYSLEETDQLLSPDSWRPVIGEPLIEGANRSLVLSAADSVRFYRLRGANSDGLPLDPATIAPPLSTQTTTSFIDATAFLYSGPNPVQNGLTNGTLQPEQIAVLRGVVRQSNAQPLAGVKISVVGHPEYGQTASRLDGWFDFVVNGGGIITLGYEKAGYVSVQRQAEPHWHEYQYLPAVVMVGLNPVVNLLRCGDGSPAQVARGSVQVDQDGSRQATVLVSADNGVFLMLSDGTETYMTNLSLRVTELTVGTNGPASMPANLPPSSGYTYCVDVTADEADAVGATEIEFDQPLAFYVENFLGFPTGMIVPVGYYDRQQSRWLPADNGLVVQVVGHTGGLADLDVNGDGKADTGTGSRCPWGRGSIPPVPPTSTLRLMRR